MEYFGWKPEPDETATVSEDCVSWCTALWIVLAKVEGTPASPSP